MWKNRSFALRPGQLSMRLPLRPWFPPALPILAPILWVLSRIAALPTGRFRPSQAQFVAHAFFLPTSVPEVDVHEGTALFHILDNGDGEATWHAFGGRDHAPA